MLAYAYRGGELGVIYPVGRGTAPVVVLVLGAIVLGEGARRLAARRGRPRCRGRFSGRGGRGRADGARRGSPGATCSSASAIGLAIAAYTLVDAEGVDHGGRRPTSSCCSRRRLRSTRPRWPWAGTRHRCAAAPAGLPVGACTWGPTARCWPPSARPRRVGGGAGVQRGHRDAARRRFLQRLTPPAERSRWWSPVCRDRSRVTRCSHVGEPVRVGRRVTRGIAAKVDARPSGTCFSASPSVWPSPPCSRGCSWVSRGCARPA